MSYTTVSGKNGVRYLKDNRFVKKDSIPADILIKLNVGMKEIKPEESTDNKCVFCGQVTKGYRLLDQKSVYLCDDHYLSKTLGEVAKKVRDG